MIPSSLPSWLLAAEQEQGCLPALQYRMIRGRRTYVAASVGGNAVERRPQNHDAALSRLEAAMLQPNGARFGGWLVKYR
jgi:hypothetical protein